MKVLQDDLIDEVRLVDRQPIDPERELIVVGKDTQSAQRIVSIR
jgi:hypothetical protein